jgi:hypothetical protein
VFSSGDITCFENQMTANQIGGATPPPPQSPQKPFSEKEKLGGGTCYMLEAEENDDTLEELDL